MTKRRKKPSLLARLLGKSIKQVIKKRKPMGKGLKY
jgi:hypothetical protein